MASATSTPVDPACRSGQRGAAPSSTSPISQTRIKEKGELQHLNDRLANYIQRVHELESARSSMLTQLEEKDESKCREMDTVRRLYEEELTDVRRSLDGLAGERARLQVQHGNLCEEFRKLQARNQKKEGDLANALAQWRRAEASLGSQEAENTKLQSVNWTLSEDVADLQGQLENVEGVLAETRNQLTSEILRRVEMENQVQTLKEQLQFQKIISEQEMVEFRSRHESRLVEVDSGQRREFRSKLAEAIQQLRQDHDGQLQQYKEELDQTFTSKLQNAQRAAAEKNDELEATRLRMESLSSQLHQYQRDKVALEGRLQDLDRTMDRERDAWQQRLGQKDQELLSMRVQMERQLDDYENLLDIKLALDMEINAYRKMLEVEEQRLHLSPSPSPLSTPAAPERSSCHVRGKKRKHEGGSGSPARKISTRPAEGATVILAGIDGDGKYEVAERRVSSQHKGEEDDRDVDEDAADSHI